MVPGLCSSVQDQIRPLVIEQGADTSLKTADNAYYRIFAKSLP